MSKKDFPGGSINLARRKYDVRQLNELANAKNGELLEKYYSGIHEKHKWKCGKGHVWGATPAQIIRGSWCPYCAGRKSEIGFHKEAKKVGREKGFILLSPKSKYENARQNLLWKCQKGHKFERSLMSMRKAVNCPHCSGRKTTLSHLQRLASDRGGSCLSKKYKTAKDKYRWVCRRGHRWNAAWDPIKRGQWCPQCKNEKARSDNLKYDIGFCKSLAEKKNGNFCSNTYKTVNNKYTWQCQIGHKFEMRLAQVIKGRWCHECSKGKSERIVREYFQQIFNAKFKSSRPSWLMNSDGFQMEFDGYNKRLGIAFEYQGEQHYSTKTQYIKKETQLKKRMQDDRRKKYLAKKHGVVLVCIPTLETRLKQENLKDWLLKQFDKNRVIYPKSAVNKIIKLDKIHCPDIKGEVSVLVSQSNGNLIECDIIKSTDKPTIQCENGHNFKISVTALRSGKWCPTCGRESAFVAKRKRGLERLRLKVECKGGRLLSKEYDNPRSRVKIRCASQHLWITTGGSIQNGSWCPYCSGQKVVGGWLEHYSRIGRKKGFNLISKKYVDAKKQMKWQCNKGHIFTKDCYSMKAKKVKCPKCKKK